MGLLLAGWQSCKGPKSYIFALEVSTDTKTIASIVKTVQRFRNMLLLNQMVLFLSANGQRWSVKLLKIQIVHQGPVAEYVDELSKSVNYLLFVAHTWGSRQRNILPNKIVYKMLQRMLCRIVIQVDFVENFTTKINCLGESVYWAYNQVTFCTACVWKHGGPHSIVIVSDYLQYGKYAANVFLKNHSATSPFICPPVSGSCHSYFQMVPQVNLKWAYCCLALLIALGSHCKGPVDVIGGTMKRLVSHEVMAGKAEVIISSEFA